MACSNHSSLTVNISTKLLKQLPIVSIENKNQEELKRKVDNLVEEITSITKNNDYLENQSKQAKVEELENRIDQIVYELYGLTAEEIAAVKKS